VKKAAAALVVISLLLLGIEAGAQEEERFEVKKETYTYSPEGRRDPFLSIITAAKRVEEKKRPKGLLPLQDYDISQIRLIAIIWDEKVHYALIGLPDGKHYTIREGVSLGLHDGKVRRITEDAVTVRELIRDYRGNLKPQDTVLRLRKEEGE
jgi:type IV pilus assembly protein PilP